MPEFVDVLLAPIRRHKSLKEYARFSSYLGILGLLVVPVKSFVRNLLGGFESRPPLYPYPFFPDFADLADCSRHGDARTGGYLNSSQACALSVDPMILLRAD